VGPKVLYNNDAQSGFFGVMGVPADVNWTDEGCIPSSTGHPNAIADRYVVDGFSLAYCSSVVGGQQLGGVTFYECYVSCTNPSGLPKLQELSFAVPGGGSGTACWIVSFDLTGSSLEFQIAGDCDGVFDGTTALDSFGWTILLRDQGTGGFNGPYLCGDPNSFPYGDGTYYQNPGAIGTGLNTRDQFWLTDTSGSMANGCYWFGGSGQPFHSYWLQLFGETLLGVTYCQATLNSTGAAAEIRAMGSPSASAGALTLEAAPVPDKPGLFLNGAGRAELSFGNGYLCVNGTLTRGKPIFATQSRLAFTFDNSDSTHSLLVFVGTTRFFQAWFRDPAAGGAAFNTSNAVALVIEP
jgi:hypothetical protein